MTAILIAVVLAVAAVALFVWAAGRKPSRPNNERQDEDTAWNDPVTGSVDTVAPDRVASPDGEPTSPRAPIP